MNKALRYFFLWISFFYTWLFRTQDIRFRYLTSDDGLPVNQVNDIIQDDRGFMWFATQDGLSRWDGIYFKTFKAGYLKNYLSNSLVNCLAVRSHFLLAGTANGLNCINLMKDSVRIIYPDKEKTNSDWNNINCLRFHRNFLICGTNAGVLLSEENMQKFTKKTLPDQENGVTDILSYSNDSIFVATMKGMYLWELSKNKMEKFSMDAELLKGSGLFSYHEKIKTLFVYGGYLYAGTYGCGMLKIDIHEKKITDVFLPFKTNSVSNLNVVNKIVFFKNNFYILTNKGLIVYHPISGKYTTLQSDGNYGSLNSEQLNNCFVDNSNNLWIATLKGGVNYYLSNFKPFQNSNSLMNNLKPRYIYAIHQINQNEILFNSNLELYRYNFSNEKISGIPEIKKFKMETIRIYEDKEDKNKFWLCGNGYGLILYDAYKEKVVKHLTSGFVTAVCLFQHKNYLLLGTVQDGLWILDRNSGEVLYKYSSQNTLSDIIYDIDYSNGKFYLATDDNGLVVCNEEILNGKIQILEHYYVQADDSIHKIFSNSINDFFMDSKNRIFLASDNGIIHVRSRRSPLIFNEERGLLNNFVYSLVQDSAGNIWFSSNKGIGVFNPEELPLPVFRNYTIKDGLINNEHNIGSFHFSKTGIMFFGGPNGFTFFRPSRIKPVGKGPQVNLLRLSRAGEYIDTDTTAPYIRSLKLNWKENNFTAEFVAIDYGDPLLNKFSYKLEGYDDRWTNPSTNRYVSYTELPGGTYTLMVKACNSEGVWNNQPYSIRIEVIPPFWKTRWFIIVSVFSVLGAFYAYSTWRTERIRKEKKILEEKVQERTRELAQKNRDITSSIEYAKRIQQALLPYPDFLKKNFSNTFILYLPKDIVSGDFYWAGIRKEYYIMAAVDCTGHGVPGAFMSLIGNNLLNQIVLERGCVMPHEILERLNEEIVQALKQKDPNSQTNDGMDVSVLSWNKSGEFFWAGANRPLIVVSSDGKAVKISGNKYPIGGSHFGYERKFTLHTFHPAGDTMFYLFSDGYADQFGGESGKKFMLSKLIALFAEISRNELENQKQILESKLSDWKGDNEQIDDILVIGVKS